MGKVVAGIRALKPARADVTVVIVDDGSSDDTAAKAREAGARVVALGAHKGVGAALARGFSLARDEGFDYLVHLDADGQIDPAQIPALLEPVRRGEADVAIGSRFLNGRPDYLSAAKAGALRLLAALVGAAVGAPLTDLSCGIRCLGRAAIEAARPRFGSDYVQETLLQFFSARLRVVEVPVVAVARSGGRSLSAQAVAYTARYLLLLAYSLGRFYRLPARMLVAAAALAPFVPALFAGFALTDDPTFVVNNPAIRGLDLAHLHAMLTSTLGGVRIPLTWLSLAVDRALWGAGPGGHHLVNLLLHALTALLFHEVCLILFRRAGLRAPERAAALAALFFCVHPLRVESVAWVSERKGVLAGALWTAALLARLRSHETARPLVWQSVSVAAFALSLAAKPNGLSFPLVLLALESGLLRRRLTATSYAPYLALSAAAFAATMLAGRRMGALQPFDAAWSVGQTLYGLTFYPLKTLWPAGLSIHHPPRPWFGTWSWPLAAHAAVCAAALAAARLCPRPRPAQVALACYALALLPMLGLVRHGIPHAAAERFSYLPALALSTLFGAAFAARGRAALAVACAWLFLLGAASWRRSRVWDPPIALWQDAVSKEPSAFTLANLGARLAHEGRAEEAIETLRRSLALSDANPAAHESLGAAFVRLGRENEARAAWRAGLAAAPSPELQARLDESLARERHNLGVLALKAGNAARAESLFREAVRLDPALGAARVNLGNRLARRGRLAEAAEQYRAVKKEDRASFEARSNLAAVEAALARGR